MEIDLVTSLTIQGISLGMLYFLIAAGLSLIFGLMDVLNLAHGSLFMWGAYIGMTTYGATESYVLALAAGAVGAALIGVLMEMTTVRHLYGKPVEQILLTLGLILILDETVKLVWGPTVLFSEKPAAFAGSVEILGRYMGTYRFMIILVGVLVFAAMYLLLTRTKIGMIVRAGVEDREMVQALGIDVRRVYLGVFALGSALAGLGGAVAGPFFQLDPQMGLDNLFPAIIVVVIGGLGSFTGSAVGALLVGLTQSYVGYYIPSLAVAVNIGLMALVLLIRPQGLMGEVSQ